MRLSPFSYVVLVLVGRGGAGPHDLRRMAEIGRVYWDAAPSQWYAEPKRLADHGYLEARKGPGRTRERTHYTLTERGREALAEWVRTPATLPRMQNEPVVRLLAADLVPPEAVLEGLEAMRADLDAARSPASSVGRERARRAHRTARTCSRSTTATRSGCWRSSSEWLDEAASRAQRRQLALVATAVLKR